jgi:hypothetical protein
VATTAATAYATAAQGTLAGTAVQPNDSPSFGSITVSGNVDGRDIAADGTKLDGIEAAADVTDAANVTAAGALMDSEVTNLAQVKAFDSSDYATAAQGTLATNALPKAGGTMTGDIDGGGNKVLFANVYSATTDLPSASTYHGMFAHVHATGKGYFAHSGNWVPLANDADKLNLSDLTSEAAVKAINQGLATTDSPTFVTLNATTVDLGNWTVTESGGSLYFATSGTNKMKLDASGNLDVVGNVNTNATIT